MRRALGYSQCGGGTSPPAPLPNLELPEGFLAPWFPAVRGTSSNWPVLGLLCSPCKVIPSVCVCPWRSVRLSWSCGGGGHGAASMSVLVLWIFLWIMSPWGGGCSGDVPQHTVKEPGIHGRGESPLSPDFQGSSPLVFGGRFGSCSTSSLYYLSSYMYFPLAKLTCRVGAQAG